MAVIDARPATFDLNLYAGDDADFDVTVTDDLGAPFDLTGYTAASSIRATADAPSSLDFEATVLANVVKLHMDGAITGTLPLKGVWDVEVISAAGAITTVAAGKITLTPEVTRP